MRASPTPPGSQRSSTTTMFRLMNLPRRSPLSAMSPSRKATQARRPRPPSTCVCPAPRSETSRSATEALQGPRPMATTTSASQGTVTIPAGSIDSQVDVTVLGDNRFETDETFIVEITSALGARVGSSGTATIVNDDKVATRLTVRDHVFGSHVAVHGRLLHGAKGFPIRVVLMRRSRRPLADGRSSRRHHARPGDISHGEAVRRSVTERSSDMSILVVTASARSSVVTPPTPTPARTSASASSPPTLGSARAGPTGRCPRMATDTARSLF